jgi:hypothetical protein
VDAGEPAFAAFVGVVAANAFNVLIVAVMAARVRGDRGLDRAWGVADVAILLVLAGCVVAAGVADGPWWAVVLPLPLAAYLVVEILLDQVLHSDFRRTRLLGPYLLLFYAGQFGMIGYAFLVGTPAGFVTLATYFASLLATWWSYRRVGHGAGPIGGTV